jgi:chemotaxis protein histidine kinase CheA
LIPSLNVEGVRRLAREAKENGPQTLQVNETILPLRRLGRILSLDNIKSKEHAKYTQVVLLASAGGALPSPWMKSSATRRSW